MTDMQIYVEESMLITPCNHVTKIRRYLTKPSSYHLCFFLWSRNIPLTDILVRSFDSYFPVQMFVMSQHF
ncbi:unnamed protein product [Brassica oleracea var. botrytis]